MRWALLLALVWAQGEGEGEEGEADELLNLDRDAKLAEIRRLETLKAALETEKKLGELSVNLRQVSDLLGDVDSVVFQKIRGFADELELAIQQAKAAEDLEERASLLNAAMAKRAEYVETMLMVREALEQEEDLGANSSGIPPLEAAGTVEAPPGSGRFIEEVEGNSSGAEDEGEAAAMTDEVAGLFLKAVREGNVKLILEFMKSLQAVPSALARVVNFRDASGATALHWCAFMGTEAHAKLAELFLKIPGVDGTIEDNRNQTACHIACLKDHAALVLPTLTGRANGCDPLAVNPESGWSCLHIASDRGSLQDLRALRPHLTPALVNMYSNPDLRHGTVRSTPLWLAVKAGCLECVELLLEAGASGAEGRQTADEGEGEDTLAYAAALKTKYGSILELLKQQKARVSQQAEL